eukprot:4320955-Amphidinium_carterae.2
MCTWALVHVHSLPGVLAGTVATPSCPSPPLASRRGATMSIPPSWRFCRGVKASSQNTLGPESSHSPPPCGAPTKGLRRPRLV